MSKITKQINGKIRDIDGENKQITFNASFYSENANSDKFAYTHVDNPIWDKNNGFSERSNIKTEINQTIHAINIDWDSPENIDYLKQINDNNDIESTKDFLYALEKIANHLINATPKKLEISWERKQGVPGTYKLYGKLDGKYNDNISWSCDNQYATLNKKIGAEVELSINFDKLIKDSTYITADNWETISDNTWTDDSINVSYFRNFYIQQHADLLDINDINKLKFLVNASLGKSTASTSFSYTDSINITNVEWVFSNDKDGKLSIVNHQNNSVRIQQSELSNLTTEGSAIIVKSISYSNGYKYNGSLIVGDQNCISYSFRLLYSNLNDIYITKISSGLYNTDISSLISDAKSQIMDLLNVKMSKIYVDNYSTGEKYYELTYLSDYIEDLSSNDYIVLFYPDKPYIFANYNKFSSHIVSLPEGISDTFTNSSESTYYKSFKIVVLKNFNSFSENIKFTDNYSQQYLTFRTNWWGTQLIFNTDSTIFGNNNYISELLFSIDNGRKWVSIKTINNKAKLPIVGLNETILFKGIANSYAKFNTLNDNKYSYFTAESPAAPGDINNGGTIMGETSISVSGNIFSLLWGDDFYGKTNFRKIPSTANNSYTFYKLFAEHTIVDVSNLILPAANVTACYHSLFAGGVYLKNTPNILPAETLGTACYAHMFDGCTSLQYISENLLPANTLALNCYEYMFANCSSLKNIPANLLPAKNLNLQCYSHMFYESAIKNCPDLPATKLVNDCYSKMFALCKSINKTPVFGYSSDITIGQRCMYQMFWGAENLSEIDDSLKNIFKLKDLVLAEECFAEMFAATKITEAPELLSIHLAKSCYNKMFSSCKSLIKAPTILPATELKESCYNYMFGVCTSLTKTPIIPNIQTLATDCFSGMFKRCSKLNEVTLLIEDDIEDPSNYFSGWLASVNATGTFYKSYHAKWKDFITTSNYIVPKKWIIDNKSGQYGVSIFDDYEVKDKLEELGVDLYENDSLNYLKYKKQYFTITNTRDDSMANSARMTITDASQIDKLQYSFNGTTWYQFTEEDKGDGVIWLKYQQGTGYYSSNSVIALRVTNKIMFRINPEKEDINSWWHAGNRLELYNIQLYFNGEVSGNIMSLFFKDFENPGEIANEAILRNCFAVVRGQVILGDYTIDNNSRLVKADKLVLSYKTLKREDYAHMFDGCIELQGDGPIILAKTINMHSMQYMFKNCAKLESIKLIFTKINRSFLEDNYACQNMFKNCTNLSSPISLYTPWIYGYCYEGMFNGCPNLDTVYLYANIKDSYEGYSSSNYYSGISEQDNDTNWLEKTPNQKSYLYYYYDGTTNDYPQELYPSTLDDSTITGNVWVKKQIE